MRLWIDGQCLQTGSRLRGIGRYVSQLIRAIGEHCPQVEMSISFNATMADAAIMARADVQPWIAPHNIHVWQGIAHGGESSRGHTADYRLTEAAIAHHVACLAPDIALSASPFEGQYDPVTPLLSGAGHAIARAAIFYDVIPHRFPSRYLAQEKEARCYRRRIAGHRDFDLLLAISDFARREANEILPGVTAARIDAGISPDFIALSQRPLDREALPRMDVRKPFLLYVGGIDWRKNLARVREACALLPQPLKDTLQFVLAGDIHARWLEKYRAEWVAAGLADANLLGLGHITDENLVQLYKQADLVIQPSLMEGFGLTALEAMFCGAPVIAANAGALPEVVGDARALFDPNDPAMIAERITQFFSDRSLARALVTQGIAQAESFSWERTARAAVKALEAAARPPQKQDLKTLRQITRAHLGTLPDPEQAALILAAAEPKQRPARGRLLIEVGHTANHDHGTGIQRVVKNIAGAAMTRAPAKDLLEPQLCFCDSTEGFFAAYLDAEGKIRLASKTPPHKLALGSGDHLLMLDSSWTLRDIFIPVLRRARLEGAEVTTVLYDLTPLKLPGFCASGMSESFAHWVKSALVYSTGFICISRAVADELLALLGAVRFPRPVKVGYWRLGADLPPGTAPISMPHHDPGAPMFLMVSTLEPRKGYRVALDAFTTLWQSGFAGRLCIIGQRGWGTDHLAAEIKSHPEWGRKLQWLEDADDASLRAHYAACTALVTSAYAEGFGLPIVEAARHGKPVIASDIPVFREVAGDTASVTYFQVGSSKALADALRDFMARPHTGPATAPQKPVTWTQSAAELENMIASDQWYRTYRPSHPNSEVLLEGIGNFAPVPPQNAAERRHQLELVEGPVLVNKDNRKSGPRLKFIVRVTNLSDTLWSSAGADGVRLGIRLAGRRPKSQFSKIPLVHVPGETQFMAIELPTRDIGRARMAEIALVQGQDGWWDAPLRVGLDLPSGGKNWCARTDSNR